MTTVIPSVASFLKANLTSLKIHNFDGEKSDDSRNVRGAKKNFRIVKNFVSSYFVKGLSEYGPPYEYDAYYDGALLFECSQVVAKSIAIHRLLNAKVDPNDVEKGELNFTPMHWCARHCHLNPMKMLVKAKAKINVLNELGQSPLTLCVMIKQALNKISTQLEMAEYLLEVGADVEIRDKSGLSPLDYAVTNSNTPLIHLILDYGAKVKRNNKHFAVQRSPLLENVTDPKCKLRMEARLEKEMACETEKMMDDEARMLEAKALLAKQKAIQDNIAKKEKRVGDLDRHRYRIAEEKVLKKKLLALSDQLSVEQAGQTLALHSRGSWSREKDARWTWNAKKAIIPIDANRDRVYAHGLKMAESVKNRRSETAVGKRWEAVTGNRLEVRWSSMAGFDRMTDEKGEVSTAVVRSIEQEGVRPLTVQKECVYGPDGELTLEGEDLDYLE